MTNSAIAATVSGFFQNLGLPDKISTVIAELVLYVLLMLTAYIFYKLTVQILRRIIIPLTRKSSTYFDDLLIKNRFFRRIAFLVPAAIIYYSVDNDIFAYENISEFIRDFVTLFFFIIAALVFMSILNTVNDYYNRFHIAKDHPISSIIQVIKFVVIVILLLGLIGFIFDKDMSSILVGLGTLSAVLMLIFRDPILGFVGGLQLIFNKMIAIGDWISMPKYGADGTVMEINLTTVKVQNFDKTIITIPTYSLISDSFQNWRGMEESGGRRIKRAINIDMKSVKFCTDEMLEKYKKINVLANYIITKEEDIQKFNTTENLDTTIPVNGRRQTNIGVLRAYLKAYLHKRTDIHDDMTFLVRQLAPSEKGIPIQIYVFTTTISWAEYEDIQADIFDHILAVIPEFDLNIYQFPTDIPINAISD